ncbi:uncharacterized protein [Palaemon carinicauda]|uniref:uncharacterized protein n=1 Tax=Palaemon carinicauda TaxID=392227 RepID=UPI0035B630CE
MLGSCAYKLLPYKVLNDTFLLGKVTFFLLHDFNFFFSCSFLAISFMGIATLHWRLRIIHHGFAPNDAEGSDVNMSPLDVDSDDDDPTYVPDEGLTQEDAFDSPNARARRVNVVVPQEMPVEEEVEVEGEVNPKRPRVVEWKDDIHIQPLPDFIHPQPDFLREPYEDFRLDISNWLRSFKTSNFKITRNSLGIRDVAFGPKGANGQLCQV